MNRPCEPPRLNAGTSPPPPPPPHTHTHTHLPLPPLSPSCRGEATFFKNVDWTAVGTSEDTLDLDTYYQDLNDVPKAAWLSVLSIERASYLEQYEHGKLPREGFAMLERLMAKLTALAALMPTDRLGRFYDQ